MTAFDELAIAYDRAINWKQRLGREIPFLLQFLPRDRPGTILDLACGSGQHLVELAQSGHRGVGIDISPEMIHAARQLAEEKDADVEFYIGDMQSAEDMVQGPFDLIICVGNSLSLLPGHDVIAKVLGLMHRLLTENGHVVIQVLNFEEIRETDFKFFPMKEGRLRDGRKVVFGRFFDHYPDRAASVLVMLALIETNGQWEATVSVQQVLNLDANIIRAEIANTGFSDMKLFGNYEGKPLDRHRDRNIVIVATK